MSSSTTFFLLAILLISFSQAKESPLSKLSSFLQSKVRASDAVDSVLNLLNDLRQANVNEQTAADDLNKTQEANGLAQIAELTGVRDRLRKAFDDAIAHREFIQQELKNTLNYIDWILNRQRDIINQLAVLAENRCYSNSMFIKSLKEHSDALKVIDELIAELNQKQNSGEALMLTQVNDISSKLKAYTTLFNNGALDQFMELANSINLKIIYLLNLF